MKETADLSVQEGLDELYSRLVPSRKSPGRLHAGRITREGPGGWASDRARWVRGAEDAREPSVGREGFFPDVKSLNGLLKSGRNISGKPMERMWVFFLPRNVWVSPQENS